MSDPNTLDEAKKCVTDLVAELMETQKNLINAYKFIIDNQVNHEASIQSHIPEEQTDE